MPSAEKGMFARWGQPASSNTPGGDENLETSCPPAFYPNECNIQIDAFALNAIVSEIINAVNSTGAEYDCARLDNLATALQSLAGSGGSGCCNTSLTLDGNVLRLNQSGGAQMSVDLTTLANSGGCCNTSAALNGTVLTISQSSGASISVDLAALQGGTDTGGCITGHTWIGNQLTIQQNGDCADHVIDFSGIAGAADTGGCITGHTWNGTVLTILQDGTCGNQDIDFSAVAGGGAASSVVTGMTYDTATDILTLTQSGGSNVTVSIPQGTPGGSGSVNTAMTLTGTTLAVTQSPGSTVSTDLASLQNGVDALTLDAATGVVTLDQAVGPNRTMDLTPLKNGVTSLTLNPTTKVLTLDQDVGPDRTVDLSSLSGGSSGTQYRTHFNSRSDAQTASDIDPVATRITVQHADRVLDYELDTSGDAITTSDSRKWSPAGNVTPLHWGAIGDISTNDTVAVQKAFNYLALHPTNLNSSIEASGYRVLEGLGKVYGTNEPIYIGNVGNGVGFLSNARIENLRLKALSGSWTSAVPSGISGLSTAQILKQMVVIAHRMTEAYSDASEVLFNVSFENVWFDCNFNALGGLHIENTNSFSFDDIRISRIAKNGTAIHTPAGQAAASPLGVRIGNGALRMTNVMLAGIEEETTGTATDYPSGEDQDTMNTLGFRIRTNDAVLTNWNISRFTNAGIFDNCGAIQVVAMHPWSRQVTLGENTNNIWFDGCYFDYTQVKLIGSFKHNFVGCTWPLGGTTLGAGLYLVATEPNTTGEQLVISGCSFIAPAGIYYETQGSGTWVGETQRRHIISGTHFDAPEPTVIDRHKNHLLIRATGAVQQTMDNVAQGSVWMYGSHMELGEGRSTTGYSGIQLNTNSVAGGTAAFGQDKNDNANRLYISQLDPAAEIIIQNNSTTNKKQYFRCFPGGPIDVGGFTKFLLGIEVTGYFKAAGAGEFNGSLIMRGNKITNLGIPSASTDAASKTYVDSSGSDQRIKTDIEVVETGWGLSVIDAMTPKSFVYKDKATREQWGSDTGKSYGLIAQELQDIQDLLPGVVQNRGDIEIVDGDVVENVEGCLGINYPTIVPALIHAVKELSARITELENQATKKRGK